MVQVWVKHAREYTEDSGESIEDIRNRCISEMEQEYREIHTRIGLIFEALPRCTDPTMALSRIERLEERAATVKAKSRAMIHEQVRLSLQKRKTAAYGAVPEGLPEAS